MSLDLINVGLEVGGKVLFQGVSATAAPGDVVTVMGESGSGKSSLLAYICGALDPAFHATGALRLDGADIHTLPTARRRVGILFQDDLLFPHMTVLDNLLFALPAGPARASRIEAACKALARAGLEGYGPRSPQTLSGGQRARVAVLRALLARPRALLLDEPFSRLDAALRRRFRAFVLDQIRRACTPTLLVTHDPADAPPGGRVLTLAAYAPGRNQPETPP